MLYPVTIGISVDLKSSIKFALILMPYLKSWSLSLRSLFVAIKGFESDGHDYILDAVSKGAVAILSNGRSIDNLPVSVVKVKNPRQCMSHISANFFGHPSKELNVIGITGTNGKTSITQLLYILLWVRLINLITCVVYIVVDTYMLSSATNDSQGLWTIENVGCHFLFSIFYFLFSMNWLF